MRDIMKTPTQLRPLPTRWFSVVVLSGFLAACGGSQRGSAEDKSSANAAGISVSDVASSQQGAATSAALVRGAALSSVELATAEEKAVAADAATSSASATSAIPLEELPAGRIAAKSAYTSGAVARKALAVRIPVYRFYNGSTGAHFFTTNTTERDTVVNTLSPPFSLEGPAFSVASDFSPGLSPVHRFFNTQTGVHFYTISESERANVVATLPHFNYEGVAYHASQVAGAGLIPFYRFFVPSKGFHFYTANEAEKDNIVSNLAATYSFEGVGYHVPDSTWRGEKLPHTGVTSSQCYFTGGAQSRTSCANANALALNPQQDGHRANLNPLTYSAVGSNPFDDCVKDEVTGLIWEGKTTSGLRAATLTYTHLGNNAATDTSGYIAAINAAHLCGFSDWRLPTVNELHGILDLGRSPALEINLSAFPNTQVGKYWSSDLNDNGTTARALRIVGVNTSGSGATSDDVRNSPFFVRLVRGGTAFNGTRFSAGSAAYPGDAPGNLVNDALTGLQWRRCVEGMNWTGSACAGTPLLLGHANGLARARDQSGWRMPNVKELGSLSNHSASAGARIDSAAFPQAPAALTWATTPEGAAKAAWGVDFILGHVGSSGLSAPNTVRLVRINP
jgi:Protein of unknown function (DUF1566)/Repeat of unknown function (DUF5648)